jgi:hypothetical protein
MRIKLLVLAGLMGLLLAAPASAGDRLCCDNTFGSVVDIMFAIDRVPLRVIPTNEPPVRQTLMVNFRDPVKIGDRILMGKYIIQHDSDRMARGEACTYIYSVKDRRLPVVAFHCTHLTRPRADTNTVALVSMTDFLGAKVMTEFQFAGDTASHGVPRTR